MYFRCQIERRLRGRMKIAAMDEEKQLRQWTTDVIEKTLNKRSKDNAER